MSMVIIQHGDDGVVFFSVFHAPLVSEPTHSNMTPDDLILPGAVLVNSVQVKAGLVVMPSAATLPSGMVVHVANPKLACDSWGTPLPFHSMFGPQTSFSQGQLARLHDSKFIVV